MANIESLFANPIPTATGPTGPQGATGPSSIGPTGPAGSQGATGPTGPGSVVSLAPMARATKISRDGGILRVGLLGMSIASFNTSLMYIGAMLQEQYGKANYDSTRGGLLSGSWELPNRGWSKQPYGGRSYVRIRADATSESMFLEGYGDTVNIWFSVEADAEVCNIKVNDSVVGTTPAAGSQAYSVKQTYTTTTGYLKLEIEPPAGAGYVYLEEAEFLDSSSSGVIWHDWTLGGASLTDSVNLRPATGDQVDGIAIEENVGLNGYFNSQDIDLFIVMHDVNDAGKGYASFTSTFTPAIQKAVEITRANAVPLVLVSSMAGHYALNTPGEENHHQAYNAIRDLYKSLAESESHITHVDWHGATILDDLSVYQQTYYSGVSGLNLTTGDFTGDFIHPDQIAYPTFHAEMFKALNISKSPNGESLGEAISRKLLDDSRTSLPFIAPQAREVFTRISAPSESTFTTDTFETPIAHGFSVGDKVIFQGGGSGGMVGFDGTIMWVLSTPTATTFTASYTEGGDAYTIANAVVYPVTQPIFRLDTKYYQGPSETAITAEWYASRYPDTGFTPTAVWYDNDAYTYDGGTCSGEDRAAIFNSPDGTDEYGPYKSYASNQNMTIRWGATQHQPVYVMVRYSGELYMWAATDNFFVDKAGDEFSIPLIGLKRGYFPQVVIGEPPITAIVRLQRGESISGFITLGASTKRIYDYAVSASPIWPGLRL
jgi:hypothetical protein